GDEDGPAVPLPPAGETGLQLLGGLPGQGAQDAGGQAGAALQERAVLGEHTARPAAARWAMIRETASRQLWSALRTWLRKPQRVVTGLNSRSRYWTPCWLRASRRLGSLKDSAKGSPWSRAKRARTSSRVVMGVSNFWGGSGEE